MILDTFTYLFTSNAKDVKKDFAEAEKAGKDFQQTINNADKTLGSMGTRLIELGVSGVAAFASFEGIKTGIADAQNFNLELKKTLNLTGENAEKMTAWDMALKQSGGERGRFKQWYTDLVLTLQAGHLPTDQIYPLLKAKADELKALHDKKGDRASRDLYEQQVSSGILPSGFYSLLVGGGSAIQKSVDENSTFIKSTDKSKDAALDFSNAWDKSGQKLISVWSAVSENVTPKITELLNRLDTPAKTGGALASLTAIAGIIGVIGGMIFGWPITGAVAGISALVSGGGLLAGSLLSGGGSSTPFVPGGGSFGGTSSSSGAPLGIKHKNPGNLQPGGREASYATMAQGVAAEQNQLKRYGMKGWGNTLSDISRHWPDQAHRDSWLKTVSQVSGFSPNQPLNLNDPSALDKISQGINAAEGDSSYIKLLGAAKGGINGADSSNLNSLSGGGGGGSKVINIGPVTVNTQATDAAQIASAIKDKLHQEYRNTVSNYDDMETA